MNSEGDRIILRIEQREGKLQVSCFKQETNHPHPVRNFLEQTPSHKTLTEQTQHIQSILCRMNQAKKLTTEVFRQIKGCGQILYDELFPLKIKERLHGLESTFLTLEIDEELNFIPWELLFDGEDFLCRRFALGRIVHTRQVVDTSRFSIRAKNSPLRMLLLYDPKGDLSQEEGDLFGGEAERLLTRFDNHPEVRIDLKSRRIERKTIRRYLREYDIVHYAGHADYNEKNPEQSGWELVDGKFVAHDLTKMIGDRKSMPLLVFSNACRSGRVDFTLESDYQKRVFSLARIFLVSGVRHYIGTFWDILNKESAEFASLFYKNLFSGQAIGEALQRARISFSTADSDYTALWSSYILYGDPSISYMAGAENKHIVPSERSETISTSATTTIRGTLSDTSGSPAVTAVNEKVKKNITTNIQWGKAAKTGVMVLGISSLVGLIVFYFYPKKILNFLYLQKEYSASSVTIDDKHLPSLVGNGEINSRLIQGEKLIGQGKNQKALPKPALIISSIPQGASVILDQELWGTTPLQKYPPPGTYQLSIRKFGYQSVERLVKLDDKNIDVEIILSPFSNWPMFRRDSSHSVGPGGKLTFPLKLRWKYATGGRVRSGASLVGNTLYIGAEDDYLYALNAENGKLIWKRRTGGHITSEPVVVSDFVYISSDNGALYAIDSKNKGKILWRENLHSSRISSPAICLEDGRLYVGTSAGKIYILDLAKSDNRITHSYTIKGNIASAPIIYNRKAYVGSGDGGLYCLYNDHIKKIYQTSGSITAPPLIKEGTIYVGSEDERLYAFSIEGQLRWRCDDISGEIVTSPVLARDKLFGGTAGGYFYSVAASDGQLLWHVKLGGPILTAPVLNKNLIFVGCDDGYIYTLNAEDGLIVGRYFIGDKIRSSPILIADTLYLGADNHYVYALSSQ